MHLGQLFFLGHFIMLNHSWILTAPHFVSIVIPVLHLLLQHFLNGVSFLHFTDEFLNIICPVGVDKTELIEVNLFLVVVVDQVENFPVVLEGHCDAAELQALDEFLKLYHAIKIDIKVTKRLSVIPELLFKALVDNPQQLLHISCVQILKRCFYYFLLLPSTLIVP